MVTVVWAARGINIFFFSAPPRAVLRWKAEVKCAFFSRTRRKTKKLQHSNLFPSTTFKHGLLEGSTFLFLYSYTRRTLLESSWLGEQFHQEKAVRLKNKSLRKSKIWHFVTSAHGHCSMGCLRDWHFYFDTATQAVHLRDWHFYFDAATQAVHRWIALD